LQRALFQLLLQGANLLLIPYALLMTVHALLLGLIK